MTTNVHEESGCTDYLQHSWVSCPENPLNQLKCNATRFEYKAERTGSQTIHYITSSDMIAWFVRRPGQTEAQMRERGEWIAKTLNDAT